MPKKKETIPEYGTVELKGITYYRTRITDADGKRVPLYAETPEMLFQKVKETKRKIEDIKFHRENPTVGEYCEKWLTMQSAVVRQVTLNEYRRTMQKYIVEKIGDMYLDEVTADEFFLDGFRYLGTGKSLDVDLAHDREVDVSFRVHRVTGHLLGGAQTRRL